MSKSSSELIHRYLLGVATADEVRELETRLLTDNQLQDEFLFQAEVDAHLRQEGQWSALPGEAFAKDVLSLSVSRGRSGHKLLGFLLASAVAVILLLAVGLYFQSRRGEPTVVKVTGLSGSLLWTGKGGQIVSDLSVGRHLPGGTIEGLAPDSWCELTFTDGSTCTVSGESLLTYSDFGQKELRLKEGRFLADVAPQPAGAPMLIHTRSTVLKVVGTKFEVESDLSTTSLEVREGKVQLRRLSDNQIVDVAARQRLISTPDGSLTPQSVPEPVHDWTSLLQYGPEDMYGEWTAATGDTPATLKAIPFVPKENRNVTLQLWGLPVWREDHSPVVLFPGSRFVVHGRIDEPADVYFGIRMARDDGEFGGMFLAKKPAARVGGGPEFEITFALDEFGLDPCVWHRKDELPSRPEHLELKGVWSFTAIGRPSGLVVSEVQLLPDEGDKVQ